jgi:DNA-binding NarL/FixJ family response regulator
MKKLTVLICDELAIFREGLRLLLETAEDIEVIGEAEDGDRAVSEANRLQPNVVLMDVDMSRLIGMEATRRMAQQAPATKLLILSSYSDDQHARQAAEAGAAGYLMKETAWDKLLQAVHDVCEGNACFSPPVARRLLKPRPNEPLQSRLMSRPLSRRQKEVLRLIAEGFTSPKMARLLSLSLKTVDKHRQALMDKLDIHEIASLTRYAIAIGLVDCNYRSIDRSLAPPLRERKRARGRNQELEMVKRC